VTVNQQQFEREMITLLPNPRGSPGSHAQVTVVAAVGYSCTEELEGVPQGQTARLPGFGTGVRQSVCPTRSLRQS